MGRAGRGATRCYTVVSQAEILHTKSTPHSKLPRARKLILVI
jgi:hypothetical protein